MIEQLEQVCLAVGAVRESDAEKVIEGINRKLCTLRPDEDIEDGRAGGTSSEMSAR